ncbi:MAG: carbohydrate ABC transporter permease [Oceanipulchritudo sp.]
MMKRAYHPYPVATPYLFLAPFLLVFAVFLVYPLLQSVFLSLEQTFGPQFKTFVFLHNFANLLKDPLFFKALKNTTIFAAASVTSLLATFSAALGGYALAKFRFPGRGLFTALVLAAIIIPAPLLIAPVYDLLYKLGLLNTYTGLILPALGPAFGIFLFRQAMLNAVPAEMLEAARIDGCGELRIFLNIVMPIVRPMVGAFLLITFLGTWNNFIGPQVILQDESKFPLSVAIAQLRGIYNTDYGMISAGTIVSIAPVMIIFLLLQREFIAGLTSGAVKG